MPAAAQVRRGRLARTQERSRVLRLPQGGPAGGCRALSGFEERADRVDVALAVPTRDGRVLVAQRDRAAHQGGKWEFPGGKVRDGEQPVVAARRELAEETGLRAERLEPLVMFVHDYADRPLRLHVFLALDPVGDVRLDRERAWAWFTVAELSSLDMPEANRTILRALRWRP